MRKPALVLLAILGIVAVAQGQGSNQAASIHLFLGFNGSKPLVYGNAEAEPSPGRLQNVTLWVPGTTLKVTADEAVKDGNDMVLSGNVRFTVTDAASAR